MGPNRKPAHKPKLAKVLDSFSVSLNMQRVILQSDEFKQLQSTDLGGYIKLLFHPDGHTDIAQLPEDARPLMRTYTIRELDCEKGQISVDFVKHQLQHKVNRKQGGYAISWAMNTKQGDEIYIGGPGNRSDIDFDAKQVILVADMTAIPALSAKLLSLNSQASGYVILQLQSDEDRPDLCALPSGMKLITVIGDQPEQLSQAALEHIDVNIQDTAIWCACEFSTMKAVRTFCNQHKLIQREKSYFSSYWKQGVTEDGHKVIKHQDSETLRT
ncbi:MAG: siderophore-interacting protein [Vibrio sp.]